MADGVTESVKVREFAVEQDFRVFIEEILAQTYKQPLDPTRVKDNPLVGHLERETHGAIHASRVAVLAEVLAAYWNTLEDKVDGWYEIELREKRMTIVAALCHDAGRDRDGSDSARMEQLSADRAAFYLAQMGANTGEIKMYRDAVRYKDKNDAFWSEKGYTAGKPIAAKIIQTADALDVRRVRGCYVPGHDDFDPNRVDFCRSLKFIDDEKKRDRAEDKTKRFIHCLSLKAGQHIAGQMDYKFDGRLKAAPGVSAWPTTQATYDNDLKKVFYEHQPDTYQLIRDELMRDVVLGVELGHYQLDELEVDGVSIEAQRDLETQQRAEESAKQEKFMIEQGALDESRAAIKKNLQMFNKQSSGRRSVGGSSDKRCENPEFTRIKERKKGLEEDESRLSAERNAWSGRQKLVLQPVVDRKSFSRKIDKLRRDYDQGKSSRGLYKSPDQCAAHHLLMQCCHAKPEIAKWRILHYIKTHPGSTLVELFKEKKAAYDKNSKADPFAEGNDAHWTWLCEPQVSVQDRLIDALVDRYRALRRRGFFRTKEYGCAAFQLLDMCRSMSLPETKRAIKAYVDLHPESALKTVYDEVMLSAYNEVFNEFKRCDISQAQSVSAGLAAGENAAADAENEFTRDAKITLSNINQDLPEADKITLPSEARLSVRAFVPEQANAHATTHST